MNDFYIYAIVVLLPLTSVLLVVQTNPFHALVMRGILGAIAALIYSILGAPDVALTEALVGTLLSITLYAVAVRSSLVFQVGFIDQAEKINATGFEQLIKALKTVVKPYHLRVEIHSYPDYDSLKNALVAKEIHASIILDRFDEPEISTQSIGKDYHITTRLHRIYEIIQTEVILSLTNLSYLDLEQITVKEEAS